MSESSTPKVILPATSTGSAIACARALGKCGISVVGIAHEETNPLLFSKYCREKYVIPSPTVNFRKFKSRLVDVVHEEDICTILPLRESDIYTLTKYRGEFEKKTNLPLPSLDLFRSVTDRKKLLKYASDIDIPTPSTYDICEFEDWNEPFIIKPRYSVLEQKDKLVVPNVKFYDKGQKPNIDNIINEMGHKPLIQEFIPKGGEFGFFGLMDDGEIKAKFQHERIRSLNYKGGASSYRKAVKVDAIETLGKKLLEALDWHGPAMVEFRKDDDSGEFKLMEINPRFWGSLSLSIYSGVNFPALYYKLAQRISFDPITKYTVGTTSSFLRGELQFLLSILIEDSSESIEKPSFIFEFISILSSLRNTNYDVLSLDDPSPFFALLFESIRKGTL